MGQGVFWGPIPSPAPLLDSQGVMENPSLTKGAVITVFHNKSILVPGCSAPSPNDVQHRLGEGDRAKEFCSPGYSYPAVGYPRGRGFPLSHRIHPPLEKNFSRKPVPPESLLPCSRIPTTQNPAPEHSGCRVAVYQIPTRSSSSRANCLKSGSSSMALLNRLLASKPTSVQSRK